MSLKWTQSFQLYALIQEISAAQRPVWSRGRVKTIVERAFVRDGRWLQIKRLDCGNEAGQGGSWSEAGANGWSVGWGFRGFPEAEEWCQWGLLSRWAQEVRGCGWRLRCLGSSYQMCCRCCCWPGPEHVHGRGWVAYSKGEGHWQWAELLRTERPAFFWWFIYVPIIQKIQAVEGMGKTEPGTWSPVTPFWSTCNCVIVIRIHFARIHLLVSCALNTILNLKLMCRNESVWNSSPSLVPPALCFKDGFVGVTCP